MINTSIGCVTTEYCNRMTVPNPLLDGRTVLDWTFTLLCSICVLVTFVTRVQLGELAVGFDFKNTEMALNV